MGLTYDQLLDKAREEVPEISAGEVHGLLKVSGRPVILDVRELHEFEDAHLPGAVHVPRAHLESRIEQAIPDKDQPIIIYCAGGIRSLFAGQTLQAMGYHEVKSMSGGFTRWKDAGYEFKRPRVLTQQQKARYSRHILIPEIGMQGQMRLLESKVLLVGAGGLGSPSALYLAAAGVGTLGIVDSDVVDESNLQRQVLHNTERLGMPKTESARMTIQALNPDVEVVQYNERLGPDNVLDIVRDYDVILDGADNFPTRYLLNDVAVMTRKPLVHGSIYRFEGQVTSFVPYEGPCYRCLYPEAPPPHLAPTWGEAGVLGVLPGIVGLLQANEVIKLLLRQGETLAGRLLMFDALYTSFTELKLRRNPKCPTCGDDAKPELLGGYEAACAIAGVH